MSRTKVSCANRLWVWPEPYPQPWAQPRGHRPHAGVRAVCPGAAQRGGRRRTAGHASTNIAAGRVVFKLRVQLQTAGAWVDEGAHVGVAVGVHKVVVPRGGGPGTSGRAAALPQPKLE